mgnify:CR=1 FL=1
MELLGSLHVPATKVKVGQVPDQTEWYMSVVEPATFRRSIECVVFVATKENHTSSFSVPAHEAAFCGEAVAPATVPAVVDPHK